MTRRPNSSVVASPVLIGAVTVLVTIVAVFLAYNANNGLPFVPSLEVKVQAKNAAALGKGAEVRDGGFRIGYVKAVRPVQVKGGAAAAELEVKLTEENELPADTTFTIRPRSPLGLKYLEVSRGEAPGTVKDGHVFGVSRTVIPVQVDDVAELYPEDTRDAARGNLTDFGDTLTGRGVALNETISELPRLFGLVEPVARNLSDPRTRLGRFFRELGDTARVLAPVADIQSRFFTVAGQTFEALSRDVDALRDTIALTAPALEAGIQSFPVQRPYLVETAALARETAPFARELRPTLPLINDAVETGIPVVRRSVPFYGDLRGSLVALRDLSRDPSTGMALRGLTATVTTLKPQLRFLGPYQTVCNYWNYFWTFLGEHISQDDPFGTAQRVLLKSTGQQTNSVGTMGSAEPANGEGYVEATRARGDNVFLHAQPYGAAINDKGEADCESGQRGYLNRLSKFKDPKYKVVTDAHTPGDQGPTFKGRARVLPGQTFSREPETGLPHP